MENNLDNTSQLDNFMDEAYEREMQLWLECEDEEEGKETIGISSTLDYEGVIYGDYDN